MSRVHDIETVVTGMLILGEENLGDVEVRLWRDPPKFDNGLIISLGGWGGRLKTRNKKILNVPLGEEATLCLMDGPCTVVTKKFSTYFPSHYAEEEYRLTVIGKGDVPKCLWEMGAKVKPYPTMPALVDGFRRVVPFGSIVTFNKYEKEFVVRWSFETWYWERVVTWAELFRSSLSEEHFGESLGREATACAVRLFRAFVEGRGESNGK